MAHVYTTQSDIYSLGCTLINLLVGSYPDEYDDDNPPSPSAWVEFLSNWKKEHSMPDSWSSMLLSMIEKDPTQRPTANQLLSLNIFAEMNATANIHSTDKSSFYLIRDSNLHRHEKFNSFYSFMHELCNRWFKLEYSSYLLEGDNRPSGIIQTIYYRIVTNFDLFVDGHKDKVLEMLDMIIVSLACFRLVLKMLTSEYPTIPKTLLYISDKCANIKHDDLITMESYVFLILQFTIQ